MENTELIIVLWMLVAIVFILYLWILNLIWIKKRKAEKEDKKIEDGLYFGYSGGNDISIERKKEKCLKILKK